MNLLTKWNPFGTREEWEPIRDLERSFDRVERLLGRRPDNAGRETMTMAEWSPTVDIAEDDKEFTVKAELPEVKKGDMKVSVDEGVLSISGERKTEKEEKGKKYHRVERLYGRFERSFTLPPEVDGARITSDFKDGVLTVHLPKSPTAKPKTIEVKVQ